MTATAEMTPETRDVVLKLKTILVDDLDLSLEIDQIEDDVALLETGLALDSVVLSELVTAIEHRFDFQFDDQDMTTETFTDLPTLARFLVARQAA